MFGSPLKHLRGGGCGGVCVWGQGGGVLGRGGCVCVGGGEMRDRGCYVKGDK